MTEFELNSLYFISIELENIKKEIQEINEKLNDVRLSSSIGAVTYNGMPHGSTPGKPTEEKALKLIILEAELTEQLEKSKLRLREKQLQLEKQKAKIEEFISTISDVELRMIVELRCVKLMSWEEIGRSLSMNRRTASRKFKKIFKK